MEDYLTKKIELNIDQNFYEYEDLARIEDPYLENTLYIEDLRNSREILRAEDI